MSAETIKAYEPPSRIRNPELLQAGRARIIEAAIDLFSRKGFHETGVEEIAQEAGLTVGALYKYVRSKHDILYLTARYITELICQDFSDFLEANDAPEERLRKAIASYIRTIDRYAGATRIYYRHYATLDQEAQDYLFELFYRLRSSFVETLRPVGEECGERDETKLKVIGDNLVLLGHMWAVNYRTYSEYVALDAFIETQTELALRQLRAGVTTVRTGRTGAGAKVAR